MTAFVVSSRVGWLVMLSLPAMAAALDRTPLADEPVFAVRSVPGNVALALSVEYPTALSVANLGDYTATQTYSGYFDAGKCYAYMLDARQPSESYFRPIGRAVAGGCQSAWSGNFLNWATMQTIDPFRWALTGGNRVVDTPGTTILEKAWAMNDNSTAYLFPVRGTGSPSHPVRGHRLAPSSIPSVTPFSWSSLHTRVATCGVRLVVSNQPSVGCDGVDWQGQQQPGTYQFYVRVQVCEGAREAGGLEANCVPYGSHHKPEGLLQRYAAQLRFGAFGYLNERDVKRDGGVLRARMKSVGPLRPVPGSKAVPNPAREWDASTGVLIANPDVADASASAVPNSGVINYINKFGQASRTYKSFDPVSELYYATLRYFRRLGNVPEHTARPTRNELLNDGFPVVERWDDPMQFSCQRNYVLGIGDVNTHADANVPGSARRGRREPPLPGAVSADGSVDARVATNKVGELEGLGQLADNTRTFGPPDGTYLMAGLAYDAHTRDIRPDLPGPQTVSTYWVDVMEAQVYQPLNQFYLAAKYGGFDVPQDFGDPYARKDALPTAWWNHASERTPDSGLGSNLRPKNYFPASRADLMIAGLNSALSRIVSDARATTSSLGMAFPQVASEGTASFGAAFDAEYWTGDITASELVFVAGKEATLQTRWRAAEKLAELIAGDGWSTKRRVISYRPSADGETGVGVPFRWEHLGAEQRSVLDSPYRSGDDSRAFIDYVRGDRSGEDSGVYRRRAGALGDVVDAQPKVVAAPALPLSNAVNPGYSEFAAQWRHRAPVVYVGANDGMLHAFSGTLKGPSAGRELFAYVPAAVMPPNDGAGSGLAALGRPDFVHRFFVNASPEAFDVDLARTAARTSGGGDPDWRTLLIGGLGKGGRAYYALDVTRPPGADGDESEAALANRVLWEFSHQGMGYSFGQPVVVKMREYGWVVLLASGYNTPDGRARLYIVNPRTGQLVRPPVPMGEAGAAPGFAHLTAFVNDYSDGTADAVYGGDLAGQVWRVSLNPARYDYLRPVLLARLATPQGQPQPVTSRPLVEVDPQTQRRYVFVGTGRLLDSTDILDPQRQSFYALVDGSGAGPAAPDRSKSLTDMTRTRGDLVEVVDLLQGAEQVAATARDGWYFDLPSRSDGGGWRVLAPATSFNGTVAFSAMAPGADVCQPSGSSRVYALDFATGKTRLGTTGEPLGFVPLPGVVPEIRFMSVEGRARLIASHQAPNVIGGGVKTLEFQDRPRVGPRRLNWREVPVVN